MYYKRVHVIRRGGRQSRVTIVESDYRSQDKEYDATE